MNFFNMLCAVGFCARFSCALARNPVLPLFALYLGAADLVADVCHAKNFDAAMGTFGTIFDIGHASGPILAGLLLARFNYLTSFLIMGAILIAAIPVFVLGVDEGRSGPEEAPKIL
jgi:predicted MFS family arabinose efflux permease